MALTQAFRNDYVERTPYCFLLGKAENAHSAAVPQPDHSLGIRIDNRTGMPETRRSANCVGSICTFSPHKSGPTLASAEPIAAIPSSRARRRRGATRSASVYRSSTARKARSAFPRGGKVPARGGNSVSEIVDKFDRRTTVAQEYRLGETCLASKTKKRFVLGIHRALNHSAHAGSSPFKPIIPDRRNGLRGRARIAPIRRSRCQAPGQRCRGREPRSCSCRTQSPTICQLGRDHLNQTALQPQ